MIDEGERCKVLCDHYRAPILELVKREFAIYKKSLIFLHIVFLIPLMIYLASGISLISKIEGLVIYVATLLFLHWIIIRNKKEYRAFMDAITRSDFNALKEFNFTISLLMYLKTLCIFLAEQDFENAEKLMNSISFKLSVDWNMIHKNKKFKCVFDGLRGELNSPKNME